MQFDKLNSKGLVIIGTVIATITFLFSFRPPQASIWTAPSSAVKMTNPVVVDAKSLEAGKAIYTKNCNDCHGKKGKGDGPKSGDIDKSPQDFTKEAFQKQTDGGLFWKITEGRKPMPSFKKDLTDLQRWQVINYVRTLGKKN